MKTVLIILVGIFTSSIARAQSTEIQQLLLNYEKLTQLKNILSDMKKGYEIVSKGYTAVKNISEGNFNLHDAFINGLLSVNPVIKNYKRVPEIIANQKNILKEYKTVFNRFKSGGNFSSSEINYLEKVYKHLFDQSLKSLDELTTVITASELSMTDDERLAAIDRIFADTEDKLQFLRDFNQRTSLLAIQRAKEKQDIDAAGKLYQTNQ